MSLLLQVNDASLALKVVLPKSQVLRGPSGPKPFEPGTTGGAAG